MVPLAGIEPALLAELDFESSASTNSATGAYAFRNRLSCRFVAGQCAMRGEWEKNRYLYGDRIQAADESSFYISVRLKKPRFRRRLVLKGRKIRTPFPLPVPEASLSAGSDVSTPL